MTVPGQNPPSKITTGRLSLALHGVLWAFLAAPDQKAGEVPEPESATGRAVAAMREAFAAAGVRTLGSGSLTVQQALERGRSALDSLAEQGRGAVPRVRVTLPAVDLSAWNAADHGMDGPRGELLERLHALVQRHAPLLRLATLNGSVGSRDMKPGWSDIDVFVTLAPEAFAAPEMLQQIRIFGAQARGLMDRFCMLQLHGVFFRCPGPAHPDGLHPLSCVAYGRNLLNATRLSVRLEGDPGPARDYFFQDIVGSARGLLQGPRGTGCMGDVLLLHRIYSFPFAWAACFGHLLYKPESFDFLASRYGAMFPGIEEFYARASALYHSWDEPCATFLAAHGKEGQSLPPLSPEAMGRLEPRACGRIRAFVAELRDQGDLRRFARYLDIAGQALTRSMPAGDCLANMTASVKRLFPGAVLEHDHA